MLNFEYNYYLLVNEILAKGERRTTRNATTKSLFGTSLVIDVPAGVFPMLQGRKMYYKGVIGELAAFFRGPKNLSDFEQFGCNYWKPWADEDGNLTIDYGNAWLESGQIDHLKYCLKFNPTDRRMLINGWVPGNLDKLSLPCCHYSYQFYVREGAYIDMIWNQRSVDVMIGLPSDIILAYTWLIMLANEFGYEPGKVIMNFGDTHIYESHQDNAYEYVQRVFTAINDNRPLKAHMYKLNAPAGKDFLKFEPSDITIFQGDDLGKLEFEIHA